MKNLFSWPLLLLAFCFMNLGHAQLINDDEPCDGQDRVWFNYSNAFFGNCYSENTSGVGNYNELYFRWTITYPSGTYNVTTGNNDYDHENIYISWSNFEGELEINVEPDWFNPGPIKVEVRGYTSTDGSTFTECFSQSGGSYSGAYDVLEFTPRRYFEKIDWTCEIGQEGAYTYQVTEIPGVTNYSWTVPAGWTVDSGIGTHEMTMSSGTNAQPGLLQVTTTPEVDACNHPASCDILMNDCFDIGTTEWGWCAVEDWSGSFATTDFGDKIKYPRMLADVDGDGDSDIIGFGHDFITVGLSEGTSITTSTWSDQLTYNSPGGWRQDDYPRMLGDFNGDDKIDVVGFNHSATYVMLSTGSSFAGASQWHAGFDYESGYTNRNVVSRIIGDFDGDGDDDVFGIGYNGTTMGLSNGFSSFVSTPWPGGMTFTATTGSFNDRNKMPLKVGDFNGDGKDDLVGFGHNNVVVAISTGSGFTTTTWAYNTFSYGDHGYEEKKYPRYVGDFNGDGMDDIIGIGHNAVAVGISNGVNGFSIGNWLETGDFARIGNDYNWYVDARELGVVSINDQDGADRIEIADINADGIDDIIGFNQEATFISYSNGSNFMCPFRYYHYISNEYQYDEAHDYRLVANIDITDDELEIIGMSELGVQVTNCNNCPNTLAEAEMDTELFITQESGYAGWTVSMNHLCLESDVILDLAGTSCEDSYQYTISEFNLNTWTSVNVYSTNGWVYGKAPASLDITNNVNWVVGQVYKVQFAVGPTWNAKELFFIFDGTGLSVDMSLQGTQVTHYGAITGPGMTAQIQVTNKCHNSGQVKMYPESSTCYSHYRIEVNPVDHGTFQPNAPAIITYPSSGGFVTGTIVNYHNVLLTSAVLNQIYRVRLYVSDDGGATFSYTQRYVRRVTCNSGGRRGPADNALSDFEVVSPFSVNVHPNPTNGIVFASIDGIDLESSTTVEVYNSVGQIVRSVIVSQADFKVDLSDLSDGVYIFKIQNNSNSKMIRVVKK